MVQSWGFSRLTNATLGAIALHCIKLCSICQENSDLFRGRCFLIVDERRTRTAGEQKRPNDSQKSFGLLLFFLTANYFPAYEALGRIAEKQRKHTSSSPYSWPKPAHKKWSQFKQVTSFSQLLSYKCPIPSQISVP